MHKRHFSDHLDRLNIVLPTLILFTSIFTIPLSRSHAPHQSTNRSNVSKPQKILHKYIFDKKRKMSLLNTTKLSRLRYTKTVLRHVSLYFLWNIWMTHTIYFNIIKYYATLQVYIVSLSIYKDFVITMWVLTICIFYE